MTKEEIIKKAKKGTWFSAKINDTPVIGKINIVKEGGIKYIYLCQNKFDGADCSDKLGFAYSWICNGGINLKILTKKTANAPATIHKIFHTSNGAEKIIVFEDGSITVLGLEITTEQLMLMYAALCTSQETVLSNIGSYRCIIYANSVRVGCQRVGKDVVEEIVKTVIKLKYGNL